MPKASKPLPELVCLTFVGDGSHYILGVPTTDLHDVAAGEAEGLIASGLYKARPSCDHEVASMEPAQPEASGDTTGDDD